MSPSTLTATGGALPSGTMNVVIQCNCTDSGSPLNIRWYNPDGDRLIGQTNAAYVAGTPYIAFPNGERNTQLVIPSFTQSNVGTYTCGRIAADRAELMTLTSPTADVVLTICKLMINTISYFVCS